MFARITIVALNIGLLIIIKLKPTLCFSSWSIRNNNNNILQHHTRQQRQQQQCRESPLLAAASSSSSSSSSTTSNTPIATADAKNNNQRDEIRLQTLANLANEALDEHSADILKAFNARVAVIDNDNNYNTRLGLVATQSYNKRDELIASLPYYDDTSTNGNSAKDSLSLSSNMATSLVYKNILPNKYDGWTGDIGLLSLLLLNEMARCNSKGIELPKRKQSIQSLMSTWISTLPSYNEMQMMHPLLWDEGTQEILQSSSTKKIYRLLDDIEDDSAWLNEKLWGIDRDTFPESVFISIGGDNDEVEERPCFTPEGFKYAVALVRSRSFYVDGALRLLPYLDYANHDSDDIGNSYEIVGGGIRTLFGSDQGALLKSGKKLNVGDEIRISYGPKGPADYLLDHGFVPSMCQIGGGGGSGSSGSGSAITAELTFEIDDTDRFRDDKLDILEYETYDLAPMEPIQTFDVTGGPGSTGEPDPAMIQFLRLAKLGGKDAFLLESIFRKEIWEFMSEPVSEENERNVVTAIIEACEKALGEMEEGEEQQQSRQDDDGELVSPSEKERLCKLVRESEREALDRTLVYMKQDAEALDLKEYYQQRRLKDLGLDSDWTPEDDIAFGGTRVPGGADYDW